MDRCATDRVRLGRIAQVNPLRIVGMAFLFSGITIALSVIINTLRAQSRLLVGFYERAR